MAGCFQRALSRGQAAWEFDSDSRFWERLRALALDPFWGGWMSGSEGRISDPDQALRRQDYPLRLALARCISCGWDPGDKLLGAALAAEGAFQGAREGAAALAMALAGSGALAAPGGRLFANLFEALLPKVAGFEVQLMVEALRCGRPAAQALSRAMRPPKGAGVGIAEALCHAPELAFGGLADPGFEASAAEALVLGRDMGWLGSKGVEKALSASAESGQSRLLGLLEQAWILNRDGAAGARRSASGRL